MLQPVRAGELSQFEMKNGFKWEILSASNILKIQSSLCSRPLQNEPIRMCVEGDSGPCFLGNFAPPSGHSFRGERNGKIIKAAPANFRRGDR